MEEGQWKLVKAQIQVKLIVGGLQSGKKYAFRARALGGLGWGMFGNVIQARVL
jgi:hypothetical protein